MQKEIVSNTPPDTRERIHQKLHRELGKDICTALNDDTVIEIMLNENGSLWIERIESGMELIGSFSESNAHAIIATVASTLNTIVIPESPILEADLPLDGSRFTAQIPPIVPRPTFSIRKMALRIFTLDDYVNEKIMSLAQRELISNAVKNRKNILIVGGTGTGKSTLINAIIHEIVQINPKHRLILIEDTPEIQCCAKNFVQFRATAHVDMLRLLKTTMRMRPDRILVGEVRGPEALALLKSWNTGHPGGVATLHANNAHAGLLQLEQYISEATEAPMQKLIAQAVNLVISMERIEQSLYVNEVMSVNGFENGDYKIQYLSTKEMEQTHVSSIN